MRKENLVALQKNNRMIRNVTLADSSRIAEIYNYYIQNTAITFETEEIDAAEMERRISAILGAGEPFIVYEIEGVVVGYSYLHTFKERAAYSRSKELSVYVDTEYKGKKIGENLCRYIIDSVDRNSIHAIISCITIPNPASILLHEKLGFTKVGHFREVGFKFDKWQDIGYWELIMG